MRRCGRQSPPSTPRSSGFISSTRTTCGRRTPGNSSRSRVDPTAIFRVVIQITPAEFIVCSEYVRSSHFLKQSPSLQTTITSGGTGIMKGFRLLAPLLGLAAFGACSSDNNGPSGTGTVVVKLTDAPSDDFQSATIYISSVSVIGSGGGEQTISSAKASFDLLTLQNGVTATLGSASVPTGTYSQIRLLVDSARVVLKAGLLFS